MINGPFKYFIAALKKTKNTSFSIYQYDSHLELLAMDATIQSKFKPLTNSLGKSCLEMKKTLFWIYCLWMGWKVIHICCGDAPSTPSFLPFDAIFQLHRKCHFSIMCLCLFSCHLCLCVCVCLSSIRVHSVCCYTKNLGFVGEFLK